MEQDAKRRQFRLIDLEARSRRNNLIFINSDGETNDLCEEILYDFLQNYMELKEIVDTFVFQRVHRLGKEWTGVVPNGERWNPRPIIAGFRDFKAK